MTKGVQVAVTVKLSDRLVSEAKRIAKVEHRSVPSQIEYYFQLALIAEQNPDLSFKLIQELLKAKSEPTSQEYKLG
jgi:hypothetical protein